MLTKDNKYIVVAITVLLIVTTVVAIGFYVSRPQSVVGASNDVVERPVPDQNEAVNVPPQVTGKEVLSKTVNDIKVEITSTKIIDTGVEIGVCYATPDGGEWYPMPGHLFYGKYEVYPDEYEFLDNEIVADGKTTGTRCALIRYRIDDLNTLVTPIQFSILRFYAPPREMYTPCQELQQRLATNPKANAYGLKAKCTETGDGNISVMLADHSRSVANDKASKLLDEIAKAEVAGIWEFTINDIER